MVDNARPCKVCGNTERNKYGKCIQCGKKSRRKWADNHPEYKQGWYKENKEDVKARSRRWREDNLEKKKGIDKEYYAKNTDKIKTRCREWYYSNQKKVNEQRQRPESKNKRRAYQAKRRSLKRGGNGAVTAQQFQELCDQYKNKCLACGEEKPLTIDHVIPLSKGGAHDISNIQPLCLSCNSRKHDKHIDYRTKPGILRWIQKKLFD